MRRVRGVGANRGAVNGVLRVAALLGALLVTAVAAAAGAAAVGSSDTSASATARDYSPAQLYNAANAYARSGQTASAVLAYERARVLTPMDPDLRANLRRVREAAGLPAPARGWLEEYGRFADPNLMYGVGVAGLVLAGTCLLAARSRARSRGALILGAVLGGAAVAASALNAAATFGVMSESVAMQASAAGVSPVAGADPLFQIAAGSVVRELDRHGAFRLVRDAQGREGWVAAKDLADVVPAEAGPVNAAARTP